MSKVEDAESTCLEESLGSGKIEYVEESSAKSEYLIDNSSKYEAPEEETFGEYCAYCKFKIADGYPDAKFCPNCGKPRITYRLPQK